MRKAKPDERSEKARRYAVFCPVPGCTALLTLTESNNLPWHTNSHGFSCDGSGLPPKKAATLQVDANGRLLNLDEMKVNP